MDDAISRSAALAIINDRSYDTAYPSEHDELVSEINKLPALDVAPMVHASWVRDDCMNARCSNCHTRLPFRHCYDEEDGYEWDDEIDETPWCMHCGARMDGEADES